MKLRIKGDSLRLRLLKSEVASLRETGEIEDAISFGPGETEKLVYKISAEEEAVEVGIDYRHGGLKIVLPASLAADWADGEEVGISATSPNGSGLVSILVEKDFVCIDREDDPDRHDAYPHPEAKC